MTRFIIFAALLAVQFGGGISGKSVDLWFYHGPTLSLFERCYPLLVPLPLEAVPSLLSLSALFGIYRAHLST